MQIKYPICNLALCLVIFCTVWIWPTIVNAQVSLDAASKAQITSGIMNKEILIMPQLNKLNFGFGRHKGIEFFYEKTISKIFFQDKQLSATITDVSIESSEITLELSHPALGTGTIRFEFSPKLLKQTSEQGIETILLETLGDPNHQYVVLDPSSKLYHLWSCNHFTDPALMARMKREDADQQGYRPSGFCFKKVVYLPDLTVEKAIEAEWSMRLRNYEPIDKESAKQTHLAAIGETVLRNWPVKLLGYDYAFYLAASDEINAFAIPTGKIIITTALFDSMDNDDELEALMAYAIAHIEQRHSLKEYYDCLEDEEYTDTMKKLATLAGALAAPASGGLSGALNMALPGEACNPQSLIGYHYDYVHQADSMVALYFDVHKNDRQGVSSLIKKLQFSQLAVNLHPEMRFDPQTKPDDSRLRRVKETNFRYFNEGSFFVLNRNKKPPVQLNLKYHQIFEDENYVHIYLDDKAILELKQVKDGVSELWLSITDKTGVHRLEHQKDSLTEDMWGAHLSFSVEGDQRKNLLQDTENIILSVGPARGPNDRINNQAARSYTFVPGKVAW
ncbi:MAG: M48 family metalloprotease [Desulfobacterales bacterium]